MPVALTHAPAGARHADGTYRFAISSDAHMPRIVVTATLAAGARPSGVQPIYTFSASLTFDRNVSPYGRNIAVAIGKSIRYRAGLRARRTRGLLISRSYVAAH